MEQTGKNPRITRRGMFQVGSATLAGVAALTIANAEDTRRTSGEKKVVRSSDHHLPNETDPGPKNAQLRYKPGAAH